MAAGAARRPADVPRSRGLWLSCTAHALHDGYTDMIYALLPVWQADFGLSYGALAALRAIYAGTMATLQLARRLAGAAASRCCSRSACSTRPCAWACSPYCRS